MDCRGGSRCSECGYNHVLNGKILRQLKDNVDYFVKFRDGSSWSGSDKYLYFLENHCFIVGVCEYYKRGQ